MSLFFSLQIFLACNNSSTIIFLRCSGIAFASLGNKEKTTLGVKVTEGEGNLPKLVLTSPAGSEAEIYLFGGCITSWKVPNGKDLLFVRPDAVFNKKKPIRFLLLITSSISYYEAPTPDTNTKHNSHTDTY